MQVMRIRNVRVYMRQGFMPMHMAVRPGRHDFMGMEMVPIVVRMGMLVLKLGMRVIVTVRLEQMQHHANQHQHTADGQHPGA